MTLCKKGWLYIIAFVSAFFMFSLDISAQNNINSPYTRFGYGRRTIWAFHVIATGGIGVYAPDSTSSR